MVEFIEFASSDAFLVVLAGLGLVVAVPVLLLVLMGVLLSVLHGLSFVVGEPRVQPEGGVSVPAPRGSRAGFGAF